jgi:hypothetical protein
MQQVYVDEAWVVKQYMALEESKGWKEMDTEEDKVVADLERELYAEDLGVGVGELPNMDDDDDDDGDDYDYDYDDAPVPVEEATCVAVSQREIDMTNIASSDDST